MVGNEPEGAIKYRGEVMLVYPASVGIAFVDYWCATKDERFLASAIGIAETYLKTRRTDGSWPLKMRSLRQARQLVRTRLCRRDLLRFSRNFSMQRAT